MAGDLNIDLLSDSHIKDEHMSLLSDYSLVQHVDGLSRVTESSSTLIDHTVTTSHTSVQEVVQTCGLSDHCVQIATLQYLTVKTMLRAYYIRSFRQCDWDQLRNVLSNAPWIVMSIFDDINDKWCFSHSVTILSSFLSLKPVYSKKSKRPTLWFTPEVADTIKLKNKAKHIFEKTQLVSVKASLKINYSSG